MGIVFFAGNRSGTDDTPRLPKGHVQADSSEHPHPVYLFHVLFLNNLIGGNFRST